MVISQGLHVELSTNRAMLPWVIGTAFMVRGGLVISNTIEEPTVTILVYVLVVSCARRGLLFGCQGVGISLKRAFVHRGLRPANAQWKVVLCFCGLFWS